MHPPPLTLIVEALAAGVARRLGFPVQARRVVRQRRTIPEQIVRDVLARAGIGQPVDTVREHRQLQPVGVAMPPAMRATLETHVSAVTSQYCQTLALEQHTLRLPG